MTATLHITGPPGSGKSLLAGSLVEALRQRGYRSATVAQRDDGVVTATLPSGARISLEAAPATTIEARIAALDPRLDLAILEGFEPPGEQPTIAIVAAGTPRTPEARGVLATVDSAALLAAFEAEGPAGPANLDGLAALVARRVLGEPELAQDAQTPRGEGGWRDKLRRLVGGN